MKKLHSVDLFRFWQSDLSEQDRAGKVRTWWTRASAVLLLSAATANVAPGQRFRSLASLDGNDGAFPTASMVQGANGKFYGTAEVGAIFNGGTIFTLTPTGGLTAIYDFCSRAGCFGGDSPAAGLVLAANGNFYGTTANAGAHAGGTFFEVTPLGKLTTHYNFCAQTHCTDGNEPNGLIQAANGNFYGTTSRGGATCFNDYIGCGTVFAITNAGQLTTLYTFCSLANCSDGAYPLGELVQASNGNFYGTTYKGGANCAPYGCGTVFEITPAGQLTTLYSFCSLSNCTDGSYPPAGLVQATDGNLYGTTAQGGAYGGGTIFEIAPAGGLTTLYSFCSRANCSDGASPYAALIQATDGNLYGTTAQGAPRGNGTAFEITPAGNLTTLYSFCDRPGCSDGSNPYGGLVQATDGNFYGTTFQGGSTDNGTVFLLSVGLGAFVETNPASGNVGATVAILGNKLTGTTSVTFNGTEAAFAVNSTGTAISATVPNGASTGPVQVVTPSGTLTSNLSFQVLP